MEDESGVEAEPVDVGGGASAIGRMAGLVEREMRRVGMWDEGADPVDPGTIRTAFGGDQMSFERWLQVVLVPALHEVGAGQRPVPTGSQVAVRAAREWTWGDPPWEVDGLLDLLRRLDQLVAQAG